MDRCLYIDYLHVGPRLDTCRILTSRVSKKRAGERASFSSWRRLAALLRFASNPLGFFDDDDR
jgi:hypothetical protein